MFDKTAPRLACCCIAIAVLVLVCTNLAKAQNDCPKVSGFPVPGNLPPSKTVTAKLGDRITVKVEPCPKPETQTKDQPDNKDQASSDQQTEQSSPDEESWIPRLKHSDVSKLVPYLNARQLKGVYPEAVDPNTHTLTFHLERTEGSKEAWTDLLSNPGFDELEMRFSVGPEDKQQFPTEATLLLVVMQKKWFLLGIASLLIVLYIFFRLAAATSLLRDGGISQGDMPEFSALWRRPPAGTKLAPFSLARTQMAFWFFVVISAFVLIWMIIGDTNTITNGVLVLIGISAGTALGATAIDSSHADPTKPPPPVQVSKGFINDILSDGKGISFHRFQIVVWTIVLGFIFFRSVLNDLAMPDFDTNLLTLMGISSGTYLGMKLPEKPPESPATGQPQNPAGGQPGNQNPAGGQPANPNPEGQAEG